MDLLKRYLTAVRFWLPAKQQDDIIAELSEDLRSQSEDREAALGRNLTPAEWETLLKERGHPLVVASGYLPQRYLIGPVLFPVYVFVLKLATLWCLIPSIAVWLGIAIFAPSGSALHASFWNALWPALVTAGVVTFIFSILERYQSEWLGKWSPNTLPPVRDTRRIPRGSTLFELVVNAMFTGWTIEAIAAPALIDSPGLRIAFTSAGREVLSGLVLLAIGLIVLSAVNLVRPYWTRTRRSVRSGIYFLTALLFALSLRVQPLLDIAGSEVTAPISRIIDQTVTGVIMGGVAVSIFLGMVELVYALSRDIRSVPVTQVMTSI
jgi:hypothetical protein